jgi:hypothetical protein
VESESFLCGVGNGNQIHPGQQVRLRLHDSEPIARRTFAAQYALAVRRWRRPSGTRAAGVSPPWFAEPSAVPRKSRNVRRPCDAGPRAAGVSPPWVLGKHACRNASAKSRGTAGGVLANAGAGPVANPRGAYAPRSCVRVRMSAGEKTICAMHERTFTRAAGVSPPWDRKTHLQRRVIFVEWLRLPLHNRLPHHGGLTPPALGGVTTTVC